VAWQKVATACRRMRAKCQIAKIGLPGLIRFNGSPTRVQSSLIEYGTISPFRY